MEDLVAKRLTRCIRELKIGFRNQTTGTQGLRLVPRKLELANSFKISTIDIVIT